MTQSEQALQQRKDALVKANFVRSSRAQMKRDLKAKRLGKLELLENPPEWLEGMLIIDYLAALPGVGRSKAQKHLRMCQITVSRTIVNISVRQHEALRVLLS